MFKKQHCSIDKVEKQVKEKERLQVCDVDSNQNWDVTKFIRHLNIKVILTTKQ
jgi:hypothetical protein